MQNWNTVITLYQEPRAYRRARAVLRPLGNAEPTAYHNVLVMRVGNTNEFLRDFSAMCDAEPGILNDISRAVPLDEVFDFSTPEDFESQARAVALAWAPRLSSSSFHVRLNHRGLKGEIISPEEERFLDEALLAALEAADAPGRIAFTDPDFVIDIETVGSRAGMSIWSRDDLRKHDFLKVD